MHATLLVPGQPAQQLTPAQIEALAPRLFELRPGPNGGEVTHKLTAVISIAAQIMSTRAELVDVCSTTAKHLIFSIFDDTSRARNKPAEAALKRLLGSNVGQLTGPFLVIEA